MTLGGGTRRDTLEVPPPGTLPPDSAPLHVSKPPVSPLLRDLALRLRFERRVAADPEELAAFLEEAGYTDELLRRHDLGGVFDAAEQLYALKRGKQPLARPAALGEAALPWKVLWRGPLLLLIVVSALGVERALGVPEARSALAAAGVVAWGLGGRLLWLRQALPLHPAALRPRLWSGTLLSGVMGGLLTAALGHSWGLGLLLGAVGGLALTSAGVMLALGRWRMVLQVYGSVALLSPLLWRLSAGSGAAWSALTATGCRAAVGAAGLERRVAGHFGGRRRGSGCAADQPAHHGGPAGARPARLGPDRLRLGLGAGLRGAGFPLGAGGAADAAAAVRGPGTAGAADAAPLAPTGPAHGGSGGAGPRRRCGRCWVRRCCCFVGLGVLGQLSGAALSHSLGAALLSAAFLQSSWLSRQAALLPALSAAVAGVRGHAGFHLCQLVAADLAAGTDCAVDV